MSGTVNEFVYPDDEGTLSAVLSFHSHRKTRPYTLDERCRYRQQDGKLESHENVWQPSVLACQGIILRAALFWYHAAGSGYFLPDSWALKMGPISCPETYVRNYHYQLLNNPAERSSHHLRGGCLYSRNGRSYKHTANVMTTRFHVIC
jgi:hypothetical protein